MKNIASRVKERRLELNYTQKTFANRSGVGYDTYRKFENTGEISLKNLILCAISLDMANDFDTLFSQKSYQSMDELLNRKETKKRQRGSRNG